MADPKILKIFHFARFDLGILMQTFGIMALPVYCTKIASRLARTYTDKHGLKDLTRDLLGIDVSKQQQLTDWGAEDLTEAQIAYAASDVLHLHALKDKLDALLARERRDRTCGGVLPIPAGPRSPGPRRLGRRRHFLSQLSRRPALAILASQRSENYGDG